MRHFQLLAAVGLTVFMLTTTAYAQVCDWQETTKLTASDGAYYDTFGMSVDISGDVMVVGAINNDDNGEDSGSAYVYRLDAYGHWAEEAKLLASDGAAGDLFGVGVSVDGNLIVVGASKHNSDGWFDAGAAYVYRYDGSAWTEEAKLTASDLEMDASFGGSAAISGDAIAIGAYWDDGDRGSAYIFRHDGLSWVQEAKLTASDRDVDDDFGAAITIENDAVVVGAYGEGVIAFTGAAYVFRHDGFTWTEEAKLTASDGAGWDYFAYSVDIDGDQVVCGAREGWGSGDAGGMAYIYRHGGGVWTEEAKLVAADVVTGDYFGHGVAIEGDLVAIGAGGDDNEIGSSAGSAYIFRNDGVDWIEETKLLASDGARFDQTGLFVAMDGGTVVVGSPFSDPYDERSGSAYVFDLTCSCLRLAVDNLVAGEVVTFTITNGTPGARAVTVYGLDAGETAVTGAGGYCATFGIDGVRLFRVVGGLSRTFDVDGSITFDLPIPASTAGRTFYFQSAERGTCPDQCISNRVELRVQER